MLNIGEEEEVFFDTTDQLFLSSEDYNIWLREPQSVKERKGNFLTRMDFVESERGSNQNLCNSSSSASMDNDEMLCERRASNSETNCSVDYSDEDWLDFLSIESEHEDNPKMDKKINKVTRWWRHLIQTMKKNRGSKISNQPKSSMTRMKIDQNSKKYMELTGVYTGQEINAHKGLIWTMKFSPDGHYLASGGEDGVICIWRVSLVDASSSKAHNINFGTGTSEGKSSHQKKILNHVSLIVIPEKIFYIEEEPLQKFYGHSSDVLDLAWSTSNHLLSSSMDKTVRLWKVDCEKCLGVFLHSNYVTCVQFNPVDENYFISGSIDGKVRIWGLSNKRVKDWANVNDIVTAVSYHPNGKGFIVGSVSGTCRFYELSDNEFQLNAEINFHVRKKLTGNKITGIEFLKNDSERVMITSEDSRIRILHGLEVVRKYKGMIKSGSQMSASLTSSGKHIISIGEDSRVYLWNYDDDVSSKQKKSIHSCEHFYLKGASVALPWSNLAIEMNNNITVESKLEDCDPDCFSLANWFSMEGLSKASMTWPEEKLPLSSEMSASTWGLVFVTANCDGKIRTFHNCGLPVRT